MSNQLASVGNPFSSRCVRPGAIDYIFADSNSIGALLQKLRDNRGWGEIVGHHGSGKSTLLACLIRRLGEEGVSTRLFVQRRGQKRLAAKAWPSCTGEFKMVAIDGFEQLSWWEKLRAKRIYRKFGCGLLITAHTAQGLPLLCRTTTSLPVTLELVRRLAVDHADPAVNAVNVSRLLETHAGNVREVLFDLYDEWERRSEK